MAEISQGQIKCLRAAGHLKMADKFESGSAPDWKDWTKLFFSNLWSANKLKMYRGVQDIVFGSVAIGLGGFVLPVVGWLISIHIGLGLVLLGIGLLVISLDHAWSLTNQQLATLPKLETNLYGQW